MACIHKSPCIVSNKTVPTGSALRCLQWRGLENKDGNRWEKGSNLEKKVESGREIKKGKRSLFITVWHSVKNANSATI